MTVREKVIKESINRISSELKGIDELINATPLIDIIEIRKEAHSLIAKKPKDYLQRINDLAKKEKECFAISEKQQDMSKLIKRKVELDSELFDLKNDLYRINGKLI